jgi:UDP-N-acetylmuramate: L-alanyl-gamma-D-glutamyl-meso-diaminopimelate ligase
MKVYFMGICGTAMGNAALLVRAAGHDVSGSDTGIYPPMSQVLADAGIQIFDGYDAARLARWAPDLVVIGNAMSRGNGEVEWLLETRAIPFTSLPAILYELVLRKRRNIVICGTHGKTTTTALTAFLLRENGVDPGFLIGGVPLDPPVGNHLGASAAPFVIEGDEYDSAFFDKRSKFIHYAPHVAVLNNLEFDHADIFRDLADVQRTFSHLTRIVPRNGFVVMNGDDANLRALGALNWTQIVRVGTGPANDARIVDFSETANGSEFTLLWRDSPWGKVSWRQTGLFNARNASMAAVAAGLALNGSQTGGTAQPPPISETPVQPVGSAPESGRASSLTALPAANPTRLKLDPLARFRGVKRRQEVLVSTPGLTVVEDFGHHPTALAETLHSFRARFPGARLTAVFEPRSNTARSKILEADFMKALAMADEVYLGAVNRAEKLAIGDRFDTGAVADHLESLGVDAHSAPTNELLLEKLLERTARPIGRPRVVVFFTNGSFDGIIARFAAMAGKS